MKNIKEFISRHKKIVITVLLIIILFLIMGIYFVLQANTDTNKQTVKHQTEPIEQTEPIKQTEATKQTEETIKETEEDKKSESEIDKTEDNKKEPDNSSSSDNQQTDDSNNDEKNNNSDIDSNVGESDTSGETAHEHNWITHISTRQVWVSNIVEVPVYETETIYGAQFYIFSGYNELGQEQWSANGPRYWFENGFTHDDLQEIIYNALVQGDNGVVDGVLYTHYVNVQKTEKVQNGTTQEDQGSYKTESYVDYYYCDCGARKQ